MEICDMNVMNVLQLLAIYNIHLSYCGVYVYIIVYIYYIDMSFIFY